MNNWVLVCVIDQGQESGEELFGNMKNEEFSLGTLIWKDLRHKYVQIF